MTAYNKLASALMLCFAAQSGYALTFNTAQVESTQGQLLYIEIPYANASNNAAIQASLADPDDLIRMGASQQDLSGLNFFVRRTSQSSGVVVITSSQPMTNKNINIVVKVQDANGSYLQQVRKDFSNSNSTNPQKPNAAPITASTQERVLIPKQIVSEKDIALNLPESRLYTAPAAITGKVATPADQLAIRVAAPPAMAPPAPAPAVKPPVNNTASTPAAAPKPAPASNPTPSPTTNTAPSHPAPVAAPPKPTTATAPTTPIKPKPTEPTQQPAATPTTTKTTPTIAQNKTASAASETSAQNNHYVVQRQDSLWRIAARISEQTHQPIGTVMNHIKALNEHAFIGGNINRLKTGETLNLGRSTQRPAQNLPPAPSSQNHAAGKYSTKYRLDQAEMTLVTENTNNSSAKMKQNGQQTQTTSSELSSKVMTIREKTVTLQKNVVQLDAALQQKDHQIQLLNARLAQLQQQLQQQQKAQKPSHH